MVEVVQKGKRGWCGERKKKITQDTATSNNGEGGKERGGSLATEQVKWAFGSDGAFVREAGGRRERGRKDEMRRDGRTLES